jgi:hypothetical protein
MKGLGRVVLLGLMLGAALPALGRGAAVAGVRLSRPAPARPQPARTPPAVIELLAMSRNGKWTPPGKSISVRRVRDLKIIVWWNVAGSHTQRLELRSPDGALYQRLSAAFDADRVRYEHRGKTPTYIPVETLLPVAGTWITDYSLFGAWTVQVYLDGATTPLASATFFIDP